MGRFTQDALSDWMSRPGPDHDVVISSRVRLARNLSSQPFPLLATKSNAAEVLKRIGEAVQRPEIANANHFHHLPMATLNVFEKRTLVEKHLISPHLADGDVSSAALINDQESISIMVNEEDHMRIQCLYPGFQVQQAWQTANRLDDQLEQELDYAFDEQLGYLTACPTNVGTGIRVSVMVHLPGIVLTNHMNQLLKNFSQIGIAVRGLFGEGSEAVGNIFQVSNQLTLGQSEENIVDQLAKATQNLILIERESRARLLNEKRLSLLDKLYRSFGTLLYAQMVDKVESAQRLSDVRLGVDLGLLEKIPHVVMDELLVATQPGFLQQMEGRLMDEAETSIRRAQLIRERLWKHLR
jgi:protein arginine kinase